MTSANKLRVCIYEIIILLQCVNELSNSASNVHFRIQKHTQNNYMYFMHVRVPVDATQFCQAISQLPDGVIQSHIDAKHPGLSRRAPVDHRHVDGPGVSLGDG